MHIILVGADFEENLGLCLVAAAAERARHTAEVLPFNDRAQIGELTARIITVNPDLVGLSIQFQHRAQEFLTLARCLREAGYGGHLTCGGQFPTMAWREVLDPNSATGIDSVVLYDGEQTIIELLAALQQDQSLAPVPGLALRGEDGLPIRSAPRRVLDDLDVLPFARRYRPHSRHLEIPFIPIMGSRGCWHSCSFCSISTFYRDARRAGGGKILRYRSPQNIAAEMALLSHGVGGPAVFCFHDDNFLLPRPQDTLRRVRAMRRLLDDYGVGKVGLVGKCRPDCLTVELARELKLLGMVRLYVGVENVSAGGSAHLNRQVDVQQIREALAACAAAGIFACYNLLLFEPETTLADVEQNLDFMREHAAHPVNFCRAEPYHGTPLQQRMAAEGRLTGSHLGYDYRIQDDQAELLFRICAAAFRERNFAPGGVHNRYMGLGYYANILDFFFDDPVRTASLSQQAELLTRSIARETIAFLEEAMGLARQSPDPDRLARETAVLGLRIAAADRLQHAKLDELYAEMCAFAKQARTKLPVQSRPPSRRLFGARRMAQGVSMGLWLTACAVGNQACDHRAVQTDGGEDDIFIVDPLPQDAGVNVDIMIYDPLPPDGSLEMRVKDTEPDEMWYDPLPVDSGLDQQRDFPPPDPPPPPDWGGPVDWIPADASVDLATTEKARESDHQGEMVASAPGQLTSHFRDTTPQHTVRSQDLPLFDPPRVALRARREPEGIRVSVYGGPPAMSQRWQCQGKVIGQGREVLWVPGSATDQLDVGLRTAGGIAFLSLRLKDVG